MSNASATATTSPGHDSWPPCATPPGRCPAIWEPPDDREGHMTERYVVAIDQGTTSTRCIVFDRRGQLVSLAQQEHKQYYPRPGWVEHDAAEIWRNVERLAPLALRNAGITEEQVAAVGIANQRETTLLWERDTG